jgi:hypothetical protein
MAAFTVGKDDHSRTLFPKHARDFEAIFPSVLDAAVRNIKSLTPGNIENLCRLDRLASAIFGSAARSHLALS